MAGFLTRVNDMVRGQLELGAIVDRHAPNVTPEQRQKLIDFQRDGEQFRSALSNTRSLLRHSPSGSWATNFTARAKYASNRIAGPKTMASDLALVRGASRHFSIKNAYGMNFVRNMKGWVIGDGINMSPKTKNKAIQQAYKEWFLTNKSDALRRYNIYIQQALALQHMLVDGAVIARLRFRKMSDKLPVPLAVELLEIDYLWSGAAPPIASRNSQGIAAGNLYSNGVESSPIGHIEALWLHSSHPDDLGGKQKPVRVPVIDPVTGIEQIKILCDPDRIRAGAYFCESRMQAMTEVGYKQHDLRVSTLDRISAQSKILHWLQQKPGATAEASKPPIYGFGGPEDDRMRPESAGAAVPEASIDPYEIIEYINGELLMNNTAIPLPPGIEVKESVISTPVDYTNLMVDFHREMAAAAGVPYEVLTQDLSQINYTGFKAGTQSFKSQCQMLQQYIIDEFCQFVWKGFIAAGAMAGKWSGLDHECDFRANAFPSVEPQKDIGVVILKLRNRLISPRRAAAELGEDFDELLAEIAEDEAKMKALGLDPVQIVAKPAASAKDAGRTPSPKTNP